MRTDKIEISLKSGKREDRCLSMDMLSQLRAPNAIDKLIYVAKGKRRSFLYFYDFYDQKYALESLLKTRSQDALNFLRCYFKEIITIRNIPTLHDMPALLSKIREHSYPNASGELGRKLFYNEPIVRKNLMPTNHNISNLSNEAHRIRLSILNRIDKML